MTFLILIIAYVGGVLTILSPRLPVLPFVFARVDRPFRSHGLPMLLLLLAAAVLIGVGTIALDLDTQLLSQLNFDTTSRLEKALVDQLGAGRQPLSRQ